MGVSLDSVRKIKKNTSNLSSREVFNVGEFDYVMETVGVPGREMFLQIRSYLLESGPIQPAGQEPVEVSGSL